MSLFSRKKTADVPRRRRDISGAATKREALDIPPNTTFRRNRTLTGSSSAHIASANELQSDLKSPRSMAHELSKQRRKLGGSFFGLLILIGISAFLLHQLTASTSVISKDGALSIDATRYTTVIDKYLTLHPIERLRFVLNEQRLNDYVQHELPEVVSTSADGNDGFGKSRFVISVRRPIASWLIGNSQNYVDANGVPFQKNYYSTPSVRIVDQSGIQQIAGTAIASSRFLNFVGRSVAAAKDYKLTIEEAIIPPDTTRQVQLKVSGHAYPIKLSLDRPVGEQIEDMQRSIAYLDGKAIVPSYLDVRISGKAFYK